MEIIFYLLAIIGLCKIIVDSAIVEPIKEKLKHYSTIYYMMNCYQCMGFWSGLIIGVLILFIPYYEIFIYGCAGSCVCMLFNDLIEVIRAYNTRLHKGE